VALTCGRVRAGVTLAGAGPDVASQQADLVLQSYLESVDVALHAPQCIVGMILQPLQLVLHLPAQLAVVPQHLHLCHDSVKVLAVISGQVLDLTDILAQVHNLSDESHVNIHEDPPNSDSYVSLA